jgi:hypothetical protein
MALPRSLLRTEAVPGYPHLLAVVVAGHNGSGRPKIFNLKCSLDDDDATVADTDDEAASSAARGAVRKQVKILQQEQNYVMVVDRRCLFAADSFGPEGYRQHGLMVCSPQASGVVCPCCGRVAQEGGMP